MNIISQLTLRHLKLNRRRTLITVVGAIISVAMLTAVATLGVSFMDLLQRQAIAADGEWHVVYRDVTAAQLPAIRDDAATRSMAVSRDLGYALLPGSQNRYKPYLFVKACSSQSFGPFPVELAAGRLPQSQDELAISEEIARNAKVELRIGETIALEVGRRVPGKGQPDGEAPEPILGQNQSLEMQDGKMAESLASTSVRRFTIVGIIRRPAWEPTWSPGYTVISHIDEGFLEAGETVDATVVLKKVGRPLYAHARGLAQANGIRRVEFNNSLLRFYGVTDNDNLRATLYSLCAIIMAIVVVGSVSLIHNSFAISVSERARHLGMLASVGATRRQKRNSVLFEGAVIGLVSIPAGIASGLGGLFVTFQLINGVIQGALGMTERLRVTVTPLSLLTATAVSVLTILVSAWLPARKASRISAMDAIRQTTDIRLTGKAVRTSALVRRLFGMEAEIGLKNLKRNRRRYQATVFSMVISIVLFLTVSFFTTSLDKTLRMSQDGIDYDIAVSLRHRDAGAAQTALERIISLGSLTAASVVRDLSASAWVDQASISPRLREQADPSQLKDGRYPYYVNLHALDQESLSAYAREIGVLDAALMDAGQPAGIVIGTITYQDRDARQYVETSSLLVSVGQSLDLFRAEPKTNAETPLGQVRIAALTAKAPMGVSPAGLGGVSVIVSEQTLARLTEGATLPPESGVRIQLMLRSTDPMATQEAIEGLQDNDLSVHNIYLGRQREAQMLLLMSVFTYGFIVLITAITLANMFNTISTSVSLRKREFAMLRSVGMTPQGFSRMIRFESLFYGIKALVWGLPLGIGVMALIHRSTASTFSYGFTLPWISLLSVVVAVLAIVSVTMLYASSRMKRENIIEALKQENL